MAVLPIFFVFGGGGGDKQDTENTFFWEITGFTSLHMYNNVKTLKH